MYFYLEEITLGGTRQLTELTWYYWAPKGRGKVAQSYCVRHTGWEEADELMKQMSPGYTPPPRYGDLVVLTAFLTDWESLAPQAKIFGISEEQVLGLMDYLSHVPWSGREIKEESFTTLQKHFSVDGYEKIIEELRSYRDSAVSKGAR